MKSPVLTFAQFHVEGDSDSYLVAYDNEDGWFCNCPDRHYRKHDCKHIRSVKKSLGSLIVEDVPDTQTRLVV